MNLYGVMRILMAEIEFFVLTEMSLDERYKNKKNLIKILNDILLKTLEKD